MPTHFVFVDETGVPAAHGPTIFGYGVLEVGASDYGKIRQILAEERWRFRLYRDFELDPGKRPTSNVLTQLRELAEHGKVHASGLYIDKGHYGGRYLAWSDIGQVKRSEWPHRLRNYVLRKAMEFHYDGRPIDDRSIDLVLDRIAVNPSQRRNLEEYITSHKGIVLRERFALPAIDYVTISDSSYTGGLQLAHLITDLLKMAAMGSLEAEVADLASFIRLAALVGHVKPA